MQDLLSKPITGVSSIKEYFDYKSLKSKSKAAGFFIGLVVFLFVMMIILLVACIDNPVTVVTCTILMCIIAIEATFFFVIKLELNRMPKYGQIINEDHDGKVSLIRMSEMTGYPVNTVVSDINRAIKQNVIKNAVIQGDYLILDPDSTDSGYIDVICPTCGASNRLRRDSADKCTHCGSYLRRR